MKIFLLLIITLLTSIRCEALSQDETKKLIHFDINKMSAQQSLVIFAEQANLDSIFRFDEVEGKITNSVFGSYTVGDALNKLVDNTELIAKINKKGQMIITINIDEHMGNTMIKKTTLASAIMTALSSITALPAFAEAEASVEQVNEIEIIEVTGFRGSATKQLNSKRFAKNISDSIFAEDMGKMPDSNIAEAMSRITGIGIDRVDGEGTEINIRGAGGSLNIVQMNGVTMTNSGKDNSVDFSAMSADMLRSIEVIKSPSANHDEGAIGGTVKLSTWKPLDIKEPKTVITVQAAYNDLADEVDPTIALSLGNNFTDNFGMTFGANYSVVNVRQDRLTNYRWQNKGIPEAYSHQTGEELNPDGSTYAFESFASETNLSYIETKRLNFSTTLQYNFNDDASVWLDATYADKKKNKRQYNNGSQNMNDSAIIDEVSQSSFVVGSDDAYGRIVAFDQPDEVKTSTFGLNYQHVLFDGAWTLDAMLGYSHSSYFADTGYRRLIFDTNTATGKAPASINWLDGNGNVLLAPEITYATGDSHIDPAMTRILHAHLFDKDTDDKKLSFQIDMQGDVDFGPISGIGFGFKVTDSDKSSLDTNFRSNMSAQMDENGVLLSSINLADYSLDFPADNYLESIVDGGSSKGFPVPDVDKVFNSFLPDVRNQQDYIDFRAGQDGTSSSFNTAALYVMADYEFFDGKLSGDFGVRYVETESSATGRASYSYTEWNPVDQAFNGAGFNFANDSVGEVKYTNFLPNINVRYMLADDMILRGSIGKVMSRPLPSDLVPGYRIVATDGEPATARSGNPYLDPTEVLQYDLSWEWYFDETGMVSVAPFYKDFLSMTYTANYERGYDCPSEAEFMETAPDQLQYRDLHCAQTDSGVDTQAEVNGDGGEIYGVELAYQQDFTFLPGWAQYFGTIINYTYADSSASYVDKTQEAETADLLDGFPMLNTSKDTFNTTLYWENETFSARFAYNYRSKRLHQPSNWDGALWTDDRSTLDFSASYTVNENLSFNLAATNLTDSYNRQFITRLKEDADNGLYTEGSAWDGAPDWRTFIADHNGRNFRLGAVYKF
jgi:TonB-dependent receptor